MTGNTLNGLASDLVGVIENVNWGVLIGLENGIRPKTDFRGKMSKIW